MYITYLIFRKYEHTNQPSEKISTSEKFYRQPSEKISTSEKFYRQPSEKISTSEKFYRQPSEKISTSEKFYRQPSEKISTSEKFYRHFFFENTKLKKNYIPYLIFRKYKIEKKLYTIFDFSKIQD